MTAKYALSLEHSDVRRLLIDQESTQGGIEAHYIKLRNDVPCVWNAPPEGKFKAHKVMLGGVDGFIFMNPNDNYSRYDFYTEDYLTEEPEFIAIETPETSRLENELDRERIKKEKATAEREQEAERWKAFRTETLEKRFDDCQKVNDICGSVYELPSKEQYVKQGLESSIGVASYGHALLESIESFTDRYGKIPELIVPTGVSTNEKLRSLTDQLQREEFLKANAFHIKVQDSGPTATVSVFDDQDNLISFMKAPWAKSKIQIPAYKSMEFDEIEIHDVICYALNYEDAVHVEYGKKTDYDDLKFPELYDSLSEVYFADMNGEDWNFECRADDTVEFEVCDFTDKNIMEFLMPKESILAKVKSVVMTTPAPSKDRPTLEETLAI